MTGEEMLAKIDKAQAACVKAEKAFDKARAAFNKAWSVAWAAQKNKIEILRKLTRRQNDRT